MLFAVSFDRHHTPLPHFPSAKNSGFGFYNPSRLVFILSVTRYMIAYTSYKSLVSFPFIVLWLGTMSRVRIRDLVLF
jgi:hypothetical protein